MSSRQGAARAGHAASAGALVAHISTLKPAGSDDRAELIRDVVDGLMRLRNSVVRFVLLFVSHDDTALRDEYSAAPLLRLLTVLAHVAQAAQFDRMRELKRAIRDARTLEKTRDALFSESFCNDPAALRGAAAELERVDAILVGLCVEHVLERQLATSSDVASLAAPDAMPASAPEATPAVIAAAAATAVSGSEVAGAGGR